MSEVRIRVFGPESAPKCDGSGTLGDLKLKVEVKLQLLAQVNSLIKTRSLFCVVEQVYKAP